MCDNRPVGTIAETTARTASLGFNHVNLLVTDLDAARAFYGDVLGLPEIDRPDDIGTGAWYQIGSIQLHLSVVPAPPSGEQPSNAHIALQLSRESFDDDVTGMVTRGMQLTREPRSRVQLGVEVRTAFCRDPSGNLIELTDAGAS